MPELVDASPLLRRPDDDHAAPTSAPSSGPKRGPNVDALRSLGERLRGPQPLDVLISEQPHVASTAPPTQKHLPWWRLADRWTDCAQHPRLAQKIDGPAWIPAAFAKGMPREDQHVIELTMLALDLDNADSEQVMNDLVIELVNGGIAHVAHPTYRDTAAAPRWRVIIPLSDPVPVTQWARVFAYAQHYLLGGAGDAKTGNPSRAYFQPAHPEHGRCRLGPFEAEGDALRWDVLLELDEPPKPRSANGTAGGAVAFEPATGYTRRDLLLAAAVAGVGEGNRDVTVFELAQSCRRDSVPPDYAYALVELAARSCTPPFDVQVARDKVRRAYADWGTVDPANPADPEGWPAPAALSIPAAPTLPIAAWPIELAAVARDNAELIGCPLDYAAWALTTVAAAAIGRRAGIRPQQHADWTERPALWTALLGGPSASKSPAIDSALPYTRGLVARAAEQHAAELAQWEARCAELREQSGRRKFEEPPRPVEQRYLTSDATVEKLADLMTASPGLLLHADELSRVLGEKNRYNAGDSDRTFLLQTWSGGGYTVDRIGRGTQHVDDLYLSILGGIQPDRASDVFGAGVDDGLAARLTAIYPDADIVDPVDRYPDRDARNRLHAAIAELASAPWSAILDVDTFAPNAPPHCRLAADAQQAWRDYNAYTRRASAAADGRLSGRLGKYPGLAARLLCVWHLVGVASGRIPREQARRVDAETVAKVLEVMGYVEQMDRRVYAAFDRSGVAEPGARLGRWLRNRLRQGHADFTARDVRRAEMPGLGEERPIAAAIEWLAAQGWCREQDRDPRAIGRPTTRWVVNPRVLATANER